jgi:hypothetical protein
VTMNYQQQPHPQRPAYQPPSPVRPTKTRRWPWVIVGVLGGILLLMIIAVAINPPEDVANQPPAGEQSTAPANEPPAKKAPPPKPAGPAATMTGGMYEVGVDVQPGQYKTPGPSESDLVGLCYWARLKDDTGEFDAIISNGNVQGPGSVTISAGEFFEATGECAWSKVG